MPSSKVDLRQELANAGSYREFLQAAFAKLKLEDRSFNYANFARRAGHASRSFARDVSLGRKRLTLASARAFSTALRLNAEHAAYFLLLVQKGEPGCREPKMSEAQIDGRLVRLRGRLLNENGAMKESPAKTFRTIEWVRIFAASGSVETGASVAEIAQRTGLGEAALLKALAEMCEKGILSRCLESGRYLPKRLHHVFEELGADGFFKSWYLHSLRETYQRAEKGMSSDRRLFYNSVFSVRSDQVAQLKLELRDVIQRFVETSEDAGGDRLSQLVVGFYET